MQMGAQAARFWLSNTAGEQAGERQRAQLAKLNPAAQCQLLDVEQTHASKPTAAVAAAAAAQATVTTIAPPMIHWPFDCRYRWPSIDSLAKCQVLAASFREIYSVKSVCVKVLALARS